MMRLANGCSTPAPKSSAAKQWIKEELAQTKEEDINYCLTSITSSLLGITSIIKKIIAILLKGASLETRGLWYELLLHRKPHVSKGLVGNRVIKHCG